QEQLFVERIGSEASITSRRDEGTLAQVKTGVLSPLQEDERSFYATAVLKKGKDRLKVATIQWPKESLEAWRAKAESQITATVSTVGPLRPPRTRPPREHSRARSGPALK